MQERGSIDIKVGSENIVIFNSLLKSSNMVGAATDNTPETGDILFRLVVISDQWSAFDCNPCRHRN